ncbi:MAG TPA: IS630 family transposase [Saprospiraceae bacterium]|nr:IS630 family transposase [Saprospiraceae bacterium]
MPASLNEIASPCLERYCKIRYWAQDESRLGLKTITRRRLTLKKVKPLVTVQWLFTAFYLYGVVEPLTGEYMRQTYDRVNTENFQQFLNDFSQQYFTDFHVIQTDNARFHCGNELIMPDNVMLLYQPPHSPQVNPAEQLWEWAKGEIANQIFPNLAVLKKTLNQLFLSKPNAFFASLTRRSFIFDALQNIGMVPDTV